MITNPQNTTLGDEITIAGDRFVTIQRLTVDGGARDGTHTARNSGITASTGALRVVDSTVTNAVKFADSTIAGAITVAPGTGNTEVTILRSTIDDNSSGGLFVANGAGAPPSTVVIANSTITGNFSVSGGGINVATANLTVRDSTVAGNQATQRAGGLYESGDSSATLVDTILAANRAPNAPDCDATFGSGTSTFTDGGHNLVGQNVAVANSGCPNLVNGSNGSIVGDATYPIDPMLAALEANGGRTLTRALLAGSPAIGHGDPADCNAPPVSGTDQRGHARNATIRGKCDIGAYDTGN